MPLNTVGIFACACIRGRLKLISAHSAITYMSCGNRNWSVTLWLVLAHFVTVTKTGAVKSSMHRGHGIITYSRGWLGGVWPQPALLGFLMGVCGWVCNQCYVRGKRQIVIDQFVNYISDNNLVFAKTQNLRLGHSRSYVDAKIWVTAVTETVPK